ncbi:MAG: hypothetical protein ACFFB3_04770 [Candidatus Hodarchaeota archaeon]
MEQLKNVIANFLPATMIFETSEEILKFNNCRCELERRLQDVDSPTAAAFEPVVRWMRSVVSKWAPELLDDIKDEKFRPQPNSSVFSKKGEFP